MTQVVPSIFRFAENIFRYVMRYELKPLFLFRFGDVHSRPAVHKGNPVKFRNSARYCNIRLSKVHYCHCHSYGKADFRDEVRKPAKIKMWYFVLGDKNMTINLIQISIYY